MKREEIDAEVAEMLALLERERLRHAYLCPATDTALKGGTIAEIPALAPKDISRVPKNKPSPFDSTSKLPSPSLVLKGVITPDAS
jgi:hypothetical protein